MDIITKLGYRGKLLYLKNFFQKWRCFALLLLSKNSLQKGDSLSPLTYPSGENWKGRNKMPTLYDITERYIERCTIEQLKDSLTRIESCVEKSMRGIVENQILEGIKSKERAWTMEKKWTTEELQKDFEVIGFQAPFVVVKRKIDNAIGSLQFNHHPRIYYNFVKD